MIPKALYEQFKDWYRRKFGFFAGLQPPAYENIATNPYFQQFAQEMNLKGMVTPQNVSPQWGTPSIPPYEPPPETSMSIQKQPRMVIEQENGYDVLVLYDENGNRTITDVVGRSATEESLTPYQREVLAGQSLERLNQADIARWRAEEQRNVLENSRLMSRLRGDRSQEEEQAYQAKLAKDFEDMRGMFQNSPRNWIIASQPNPFLPQEKTADASLASIQEEAKRASSASKTADKEYDRIVAEGRLPTPEEQNRFNIVWSWATETNRRKDQLELAREAGMRGGGFTDTGIGEAEQAQAGQWATPRPTGSGNFLVGEPETPKTPTMPKIPDWLAQASGVSGYVPEKGTKVPILTPSGQSWMAMTPTQQEMFGGLVDWAGQRTMEDILTQTQSMLPKSPSLGRKWTPARQMI